MIRRSEIFGTVAKQYQKYRSNYNLKTYRLLASLLGGAGKKYKILDIGCGTGKSTEPLAKVFKKAEIIGCDPDEKMLDQARQSAKKKKLAITYIKGRAEKLPFTGKYFDAVIAGTAFHWFGTKKVAREISRVLKKKGVIFIFWRFYKDDGAVDWRKVREKYGWKSYANKFKNDEQALTGLLAESGFVENKIVRISFVERKTAAQEIGGIKTNSSFLLLPEDKKKECLSEMSAAYKKAQGKKKCIVGRREMFIGYGFKK